MTCVLRASGSKQAVRDFENKQVLKNAYVHIKGLPINQNKPDGRVFQSSGISIAVSRNKLWEDLPTQINQAVAFLKKNSKGIKELRSFGFKDIRLDFGVWKKDVWAQYDYFPPRLIQLAAQFQMGIELSQYHSGIDKPSKKLF